MPDQHEVLLELDARRLCQMVHSDQEEMKIHAMKDSAAALPVFQLVTLL